MNEMSLSKDLNVITAEINSYKQVAGQSIFEIGKRLKHVKENDLVHGEFGEWLEIIEMSNQQASRFVKVYEEIPQSDFSHVGNISFRAMYEIATLPQEEREKEHTLSSGETKKVDEMTVRELEEVKKKNKEIERQLKQARESEQIAIRQLEEERSKEPITKEIVKEIVPDEVNKELEHMRKMVTLSKSANEELQKEIDTYKLKDTSDFDEKATEWELKKLQIEADRNTTQVRLSLKQLNNKISISKFMYDAISASNEYEKSEMKKEINILKDIINGIEASLKNRREIN